MRVEVSLISLSLSGPVFSRILVSICLILKFLDERELNYFYSFISMIDKDKTATTKKSTTFFVVVLNIFSQQNEVTVSRSFSFVAM